MDKLTSAQKQLIAQKIKALDPNNELVTIEPNENFSGGKIAFNKISGIAFGEATYRLTDEEYVRAYLVVRLVKELRYSADALQLEQTYTIGRPSSTKAQIDIKVLDKRGKKPKPFMLIEAKRPDDFDSYQKLIEDQLFKTGNQDYADGVKYVVWYSLEFQGDNLRDKCIVIDIRKYTKHKDWIEAGEIGHNLDMPIEYGTVRKQRYVKGEKGGSDLRKDLKRSDLETLRRDFHNVFWGGAKMGDTDVFNNLLRMFLVKIYDELTTDEGQPYAFQIELKDDEPESSSDIVAKVNRLYQAALQYFFGYTDDTVSANKINENRFPPNKVMYVLEKLEGISLIENRYEDDVLGIFFESIVRTGFKQEKGQFFTHTNIVRFILYALEVDTWVIDLINGNKPTLPYIIDPSCGSGTFLIEAMKIITNSVLRANKEKLKKSNSVRTFVDDNFRPTSINTNSQNRWAKDFIYGIEDGEDLATATKVNMILHGDGNANILKGDGLAAFERYTLGRLQVTRQDPNAPYAYPINEQFDCIVSNPPFSLKEDTRTINEYGTRFAYAGQRNSENLFVERWYQLLKEGGRLGVVLPDSVFDTNENVYIRLMLYRYFKIRAVVSLPQISFQPYTPTKTSLLFALKKTRKEVAEWDAAWRKATNDFGKLRKSAIVDLLMRNDRVRNKLIDAANKAEVEWYPATNLLSADTLPHATREAIQVAHQTQTQRAKDALKETLDAYDAWVIADALGKLSQAETQTGRTILTRLLRDRLPLNADALTLAELAEATYDDVLQAAELNYTEEPNGQPYCNAWWAFAEVTAQPAFDYDIFFAEADNVGYKRTTRHPEGIAQPNDLFQEDKAGGILPDADPFKTILEQMRSKQLFFCQAATLDEADAVRVYHQKLKAVAVSFTLRFSYRYLHPKYELLERLYLRSGVGAKQREGVGVSETAEAYVTRRPPVVQLKSFCARPVMRGVQPSYDDDSKIFAIKTANLKNSYIDFEDAQTVSEEFFANVQRRAGICKGDVLISTTGVGSLGKVDYYDVNAPAIADGHIAILRVMANSIEPHLLTHLLRSRVAQWQIERLLSGATNQIEIYNDQIANLRLPGVTRDRQQSLFAKVFAIESAITAARTKLRKPANVIDEVMCAAFGYPLAAATVRGRGEAFAARVLRQPKICWQMLRPYALVPTPQMPTCAVFRILRRGSPCAIRPNFIGPPFANWMRSLPAHRISW